jgi:hypothetical protein
MATAYKVLGQVAPAATTGTALYTVPASTQTVISTISVCNRAATAGTFRIYLRPNDEALADKHYLVYDAAIAANDSLFLTLGITADAADVLYVYASSANMSFQAFGSEIS